MPKNLESKIGRYVNVHINIGVQTYEACKKYASKNDMSLSDILRIAINDWCSRKGFYSKWGKKNVSKTYYEKVYL